MPLYNFSKPRLSKAFDKSFNKSVAQSGHHDDSGSERHILPEASPTEGITKTVEVKHEVSHPVTDDGFKETLTPSHSYGKVSV